MSAVQTTRTSPRRILRQSLSYGILVAATVLISVPIVWFIVTSLKTDVEYNAWPIKFFPAELQWQNYGEVFAPRHRFLQHVRNSLVLAISYTVLSVITSSMAGYAFSRFQDVPGRDRLFGVVIATKSILSPSGSLSSRSIICW